MSTVFFDLDGVFNAYLRPGDLHDENTLVWEHSPETWVLDRRQGAWLSDIRSRGHNAVWLSAWEQDSDDVCNALRLPPLGAHVPLLKEAGIWNKIPSLEVYLATHAIGGKIAWIDDEHDEDSVAHSRPFRK